MSAQPGVPLQGIGIAPNVNLNEALWRVGGMHGRAMDLNGNLIHEAIEVQAEVAIDRLTVQMAGTARQGHKPGRETREGTLNVQKLDTAWEMSVWRWLTARETSPAGTAAMMSPFSVIIQHADPGALGYEQWQLDGCLVWSLPLGFNIGDDIRQLSLPLTWERETPLHAYERTGALDANGMPAVKYVGALDAVAA